MNEHIQALEERLRQAQLHSDIQELDGLISNDLQFILHDGSVVSKEDDLRSHRAQTVKFQKIEFSEQEIRCLGDSASVTVKAEVELEVEGKRNHLTLRYGRTWTRVDEKWKIISGNVTLIQEGRFSVHDKNER